MQINQLVNSVNDENNFKKILETINQYYLNITDSKNNYVLNYVITLNKLNIVRLLLEKGSRLDILDNDGMSILFVPIKYNYDELFDLLISHDKKMIGISIVNIKDINDDSAINYAIKYNNDICFKKLIDNKANVFFYNKIGLNPLHLALTHKQYKIIEICLSKYPNLVNLKTTHGNYPIHLAVITNNEEIVKLILDFGANINSVSKGNGYIPLQLALRNKVKNSISKLLLTKNTDINAQDEYGITPINSIIYNDNIEMFDEIIKFEPNVNLWDYTGSIPLHYVLNMELKHKDIFLDYLIKKSNLNIQNKYGDSCFHILVMLNLWKKYDLINKKLNFLLRNNENKRSIDYIKTEDWDDMLILLTKNYIYRLRNKDYEWENEWENLCKTKQTKNELKKFNLNFNTKIKFNENGDACYNVAYNEIIKIINTDSEQCKFVYPKKKNKLCVPIKYDNIVNSTTFLGSYFEEMIGYYNILKKYNEVITLNPKKMTREYFLSNAYIPNVITFAQNNLVFPENFDYVINEITESKYDFLIIHLGIHKQTFGHANSLIYDIKKNEIERFEPHGITNDYDSDLLDDLIKKKLKYINKNLKYISPKDFLPHRSFQSLENYFVDKKIGDPNGFCAAWSLWYTEMRIKHKNIDRKKLVKKIIKYIKYNNISFMNLIRNYTLSITKERDKLFAKANMDINDFNNYIFTENQFDIIMDELENLFVDLKN